MTGLPEYNGWAGGYPTWCVNLWLSNTEGDYNYWTEAAADALADAGGDASSAALALADRLRDELDEAAPDLGATLWGDLLTWAIGMADYTEIAENWIADAAEAGQ